MQSCNKIVCFTSGCTPSPYCIIDGSALTQHLLQYPIYTVYTVFLTQLQANSHIHAKLFFPSEKLHFKFTNQAMLHLLAAYSNIDNQTGNI